MQIMERLSEEGRAIFETVAKEAAAQHEKDQKELKALITQSVDVAMSRAVESTIRPCITKAQGDMQVYADGVESMLLQQLESMRDQFGLTASDGSDPLHRTTASDAETGPDGRRCVSMTRRPGVEPSGLYVPPPARGMRAGLTAPVHVTPRSFDLDHDTADGSSRYRMPKMDVPRFDGEQPKLWQIQCEDYFEMYGTAPSLWVRLASLQFTGPAARWLSSIKTSIRKYTWQEFSQEVVFRFDRNQHQSLIRKLYKLVQTSSVEEYVNQFAELIDQLAAYESTPDVLHYVTRFIEGLKPAVRLLVAVQLPQDLETAYNIALVQGEVGDGLTTLNASVSVPRRTTASPHFHPGHSDDRRSVESVKPVDSVKSSEDKLIALRNYRRAKGLCFTCGEKYSRDHKCQSTVQLHVVQEMVDFFMSTGDISSPPSEVSDDMELMQLAANNDADTAPECSIILTCSVQGKTAVFLLDSGSNNSFLSSRLANQMQGKLSLPTPRRVKVAGGGIFLCTQFIPQCQWTCGQTTFCSSFKVLPLQGYDGIVGMDWLSTHSPQLVDWQQKWLAFPYQGKWVCLHGNVPSEFACAVIEVHMLSNNATEHGAFPPEIQKILDTFVTVFSEPSGLPPKREVTHSIPLVEGARPVQIRPYRFAPALKDEIEHQIADMLQSGVIRPSNSNFASPLIMVKKKDDTWRPCVDYRHLNALTIKSKYPLPVIDELLDELHGACYFSKLDLRAGYHQIHLTEGDEYKTAFHTHHGHFEFTVMAFGLTGAPATFQAEMNRTLSSLLRKCVLVFFDDILIYSSTYQEHLGHLNQVLKLLEQNQWKVKMSKCAFAQTSIQYLGHVISANGVATDHTKIAAVRDWPVPQDAKQLRSFLGLAGYYRKYVRNYASISKPLTQLLHKNAPFVWTSESQIAFDTLKQALVNAPVLALPDFSCQFIVETDACDQGIGAVLIQKNHPLAFVSKALGPRNRGLSTYEKEYMAILLAVEQWRSYLQHSEFIIRTDHASLAHLQDQRLHTPWQHKVFTKLMGLQYCIVYKKGCENRVADALSRRPHPEEETMAISSYQPQWILTIVDAYQQDTAAQELLQRLAIASVPDDRYTLRNGIIRKDGKIWIPNNSVLQQSIIRELHNSPMGGHSGIPVTLRRLKQLFSWRGMPKSVHEFVQSCSVCQQAKPDRSRYPGLLQPLPVPDMAWQVISMDFIEGLPRSGRFNCILVVVDKFSRYAHFIPLAHPFSAADVAVAFMDNVFKLHSLPEQIISDRDRVFNSLFWRQLFSLTGTTLSMSSSYHPQTDGQTERVNQCLEGYLRCFAHACPTKWIQWLSLAEFWYNTSFHSSLGKSPFEVLYGRSPRQLGITPDSTCTVPDLEAWLAERQLMQQLLRQHLERVRLRMKHQTDKKRT